MSNKSYGLGYERKEKKAWEEQGFTVMRSRGSFGLFDLLIAGKDVWYLISVKSTKLKYFSYKKEVEELKKFRNAPRGTRKMLVLYHKGKRKTIYSEEI